MRNLDMLMTKGQQQRAFKKWRKAAISSSASRMDQRGQLFIPSNRRRMKRCIALRIRRIDEGPPIKHSRYQRCLAASDGAQDREVPFCIGKIKCCYRRTVKQI